MIISFCYNVKEIEALHVDDLTLISSDKENHRNALSRIDLFASDLDLAIRADK